MKTTNLLRSVLFAAVLVSCSSEDEPKSEPESLYQEEGFLLSSISQSTAGYSYYAGFFPQQPSGEVDLTKNTAYSTFLARTSYKNFIYGISLDGDKKLSKQAILKSSGAVVEIASIPLLEYLQAVLIVNENLGVYSTSENRSLFLFNPATMENLGRIDMSKAKNFPENEGNVYGHLSYRPNDNKLFASLLTNSSKTGQFYDAQDVYVEVVDLTTKKWEKTAVFKQATYPVSRGLEHSVVDEAGNVYISTQGQYGLDGQLGPNAAKRSRPQILKIPAGKTDFDSTYAFNPINAVGQQSSMFQLLLGTIYDANGIAYACISAAPYPPRLLELIGKLAVNSITAAEYAELSNLAFYSPVQRWAKLDLNAQTATVISDLPLTAAYSYPSTHKYEGKFYLPVYNPSMNLNGYYQYDPAAGKSEKLVNVTAGGIITDLLKLTK
ncbi:hypothetical protein [Dyadobacter pollutisoli]|uniref:DUF4374 domain-containing protein n=1 Tax=Dyadobacter pollutisoli TaxID=2910158 RepID=A0A9E8NAI4_9BACT|nr:hypothetical protein [Dyadobacter pollutisoli]WAC13039.1 hypothetical protein ON006_03545 [Dyadobacter pollutisoli]